MEIKIYKITVLQNRNNAQKSIICWVSTYKMQRWNESNSISTATFRTSVLVPQ